VLLQTHVLSDRYALLPGAAEKVSSSSYIVPFVVCIISKPSDMDHTVLPANYKMPAFPRKHSPDGATPN